jgi:hypothetical protein
LTTEQGEFAVTKELSESAQKLLQLIPADGSFKGNTTLRRDSGLADEYWKVRDELEKAGLITLGKGRGGSVALQPTAPVAAVEAALKDENLVDDESKLYDPLKKLLDHDWGNEAKETEDFFELRITASPRERSRDSGQWSRPDLTLVEVNTFEYLPGSNLEVTTFEVKRFADVQNIASVYEAAAHSRWAHYAYLVAEVPKEKTDLPDRFVSEVQRFRIGLMIMWLENGEWKFDVSSEPLRLVPEPKELDKLLKAFFNDSKRAKEFKARVRS